MALRWLFFLLVPLSVSAQKPTAPTLHTDPAGALQTYRENLTRLRQEHPNHRELPDLKFFLFGMGDRLKLIYRNGRLLNALTGNIEEQWTVKQEIIVPSNYLVHLTLADGQVVQIHEDETGVWIIQPNKRPKLIPGTRSPVNLPRFTGQRFGPILRVLHQEILINIIYGRPVPNFLVYQKPWYRDAAVIAMVLKETDNLHLIHDWIMAIHQPFDRNNHGVAEADNLGEVLFLVSLVSDKNHPAVQMMLDSAKQFRTPPAASLKPDDGIYIAGKTDYTEHPVYQTKWLRFGLKSLGLSDPYIIPKLYDSYSSLVWWAYTTEHVEGKKINDISSNNYPYLAWAEDHFFKRSHSDQSGGAGSNGLEKRSPVGNIDYPLSWEQLASEAHYPGMTVLDKDIVKRKLAFPHAWHAAEMFLLLQDQ